MSDPSSSLSTPRKHKSNKNIDGIPSWRAHSLSKNSCSPARLTYVLAEPEHGSPLASAKSKLPVSVLYDEPAEEKETVVVEDNSNRSDPSARIPRRSFRGVGRPGRTASEFGPHRLILDTPETSPSPASRRVTRAAAYPAPAYMTVREHKRAGTLLESPVSVHGWFNTPKEKGKEKEVFEPIRSTTEEPQALQPLDVSNVNPSLPIASSSKRARNMDPEIPPSSNVIPPTPASSASNPSINNYNSMSTSNPTSHSLSTFPSSAGTTSLDLIVGGDRAGCNPNSNDLATPTTTPDRPVNINSPTNVTDTPIESTPSASQPPRSNAAPGSSQPSQPSDSPTPPARSASDKGTPSTSWFRTPWLGWTSPASDQIPISGASGSRGNDGDLVNQRTRDQDSHDNGDGQENVHERSGEGGSEASAAPKVSSTLVDDGADNATMSVLHGDGTDKGSCPHVDKSKSTSATSAGSIAAAALTATHAPNENTAMASGSGSVSARADNENDATRPGQSAQDCAANTQATIRQESQESQTPGSQEQTTAQANPSWWDYIVWRSGVPTNAPAASPAPTIAATSTPAAAPTNSNAANASSGTIDAAQSVPVCNKPEGGDQEDKKDEKDSQGNTAPAASSSLTTSPSRPNEPSPGPKDPTSENQSRPSLSDSDSSDLEGAGASSNPKDDREEARKQGKHQVHGTNDGHDHVHASSWFNPWSWYGSSGEDAQNATLPNPESTKDPKDEKAEETPEVQILVSPPSPSSAAANPVSPATPAIYSGTDTSVTSKGAETNPVVATVDSHRSSWISFFASGTSRTLITKTITAPNAGLVSNVKVDENGVEVMDIDDEAPSSQEVQASQEPSSTESPKAKETEKETKTVATASTLSPSQSLMAVLVGGRGRVRYRADLDKDSVKDGNSDTSSVRSGMVGQGSDAVTPNEISIPSKPGAESATTTAVGSVSSSPSSTSTSLVKKVSLTLTGVTTKANRDTTATSNGNAPAPTSAINEKNGRNNNSKSASPAPSPTSKKPAPPPPPPNLVLPSWQESFYTAPRSIIPPRPEAGTITKTMQYVSGWLFSGGRSGGSALIGSRRKDNEGMEKGKRRASSTGRQEQQQEFMHFGQALPRAWDIVESVAEGGGTNLKDVLSGCKRVVVIGVHGWFPGAVMRTVIGEPTGTSSKFANMMVQALEEFENDNDIKFEKITKIPLEGEGTIQRRVEKLYTNLLGNQEWMDDIKAADAILVATHSQGSVVSTHLLDRLITDRHLRASRNSVVLGPASSFPAPTGMETTPAPKAQRVCCLAMCGIHLGPLRYLSTSSLFQPYFQYLESPAARELFEFQNTESEVSKEYVKALRNVLSNGVKMLYVASLNDQVVPLYSGLFTAASHPLILRALYIDGDAYNSSDFLANLLVLLLRILNSGIPDSGLLVHLSEATAGSLNGVGHSTAYEEIATYSLAVKYLFLTNDGLEQHPELVLDAFNARQEQNDYEIPWALRDVIADDRVTHFFSKEIVQLRDAFREWHPRTSILRDLKRKLQPIQRLPASFVASRL